MLLLLRCVIVSLVVCTSWAYTGYARGHCQPVPKFCRNLTNGNGYAFMRLPNAFNNYHLNETVKAIRPWQLLVGQCHAGLKLFLCAIYAPICLHDKESGKEVIIKLCRSFCSRVRSSCEPVMNSNNYSWPTHDAFNCSQYKDDLMCVREDFVVAATTRPPVMPTTDNDMVCNPNLNGNDLRTKVCRRETHLAFRAEVTSIRRETKGLYSLLRFKRSKKSGKQRPTRNSRKSGKKAADSLERALILKSRCPNLVSRVKINEAYLIIVDLKRFKKTVRYSVEAIVPWNKRHHRKLTKPKNIVCK